jgi:hypothetical protein
MLNPICESSGTRFCRGNTDMLLLIQHNNIFFNNLIKMFNTEHFYYTRILTIRLKKCFFFISRVRDLIKMYDIKFVKVK